MKDVHLVELGAGRNDLLDAELAELRLELAELLHQVILALVPELDRLNLCGRLRGNFGQQKCCGFPNHFDMGIGGDKSFGESAGRRGRGFP